MSYLLVPPRRIFFGCLVAPAVGSGETPLVDVRTVWRTLDPHVRERFVRRGIRIVRNLRGPASRFRLWTQVRWDDFFQTADRATIEAQCRAEHFGFAWTADDGLRLTITQPVTRTHPVTGETAWVNQFLADHAASSAHEYRRIFRLRPSFRLWRTWQFVRLTALLKLRSPLSTLAFHCTYADGSRIPVADMNALRATVWRHLAIPPWQAGDVMAIDNLAVAHGRLPCWGPRQIVACLAR
jgi:alpha-ketoglutarate-dependent taurine dioxygenase